MSCSHSNGFTFDAGKHPHVEALAAEVLPRPVAASATNLARFA